MCMHFEVEFRVNHHHIFIEEDILNILGASEVSKIIEGDSIINEVVVPSVLFSQAHEAMATLSTFPKQQQSNVIELREKLLSLDVIKLLPSLFPVFKSLIKQQ